MQLDTTTLPENLYWPDEFDFKPVAQSKNRAVSGGMVIESQSLSYGQPITLTGGWATRTEVQALKAMEAAADTVRTLTLDDGTTTYSVLFDIEAGGVEAPQLSPEHNPTDTTKYVLTLHLVTVEPPE